MFFKVSDEKIISKVIEVLHQRKVPVTFWFPNKILQFETTVRLAGQAAGPFLVEVPEHTIDLDFLRTAQKKRIEKIFGSFQFQKTTFFFESTWAIDQIALTTATLSVPAPTTIFKLQRRAAVRVPAPARTRASFYLPTLRKNRPFTGELIDMSTGGVSIRVTGETLPSPIENGAAIKDLDFAIQTSNGLITIHCNGTFKNVRDQNKVGVQFEKLPPNIEQQLAKLILEESRKLFCLLNSPPKH